MPTLAKIINRRYIALVVVIIFILLIIITLVFPPSKKVSTTFTVSDISKTPSLTDKVVLEQTFVAPENAESLGIYFPNYLNFFDHGELKVKFTNSNKEITDFSYPVDTLLNESYVFFDYPTKSGESYTMYITVSDISKEKDFAFSTTSTVPDGTKLKINNKPQSSALIMTFISSTSDYFPIWYYITGIVFVCLYFVLTTDRRTFYEKTR